MSWSSHRLLACCDCGAIFAPRSSRTMRCRPCATEIKISRTRAWRQSASGKEHVSTMARERWADIERRRLSQQATKAWRERNADRLRDYERERSRKRRKNPGNKYRKNKLQRQWRAGITAVSLREVAIIIETTKNSPLF